MRLHITVYWILLTGVVATASAAPVEQQSHSLVSVNFSAGGMDSAVPQRSELSQLEKFIDTILPSLLDSALKNISFQRSYSMSFTTSFEKLRSSSSIRPVEMPAYNTARRTRELVFDQDPLVVAEHKNLDSYQKYFPPNDASTEFNKRSANLIPVGFEREVRNTLEPKFVATTALDASLGISTPRSAINSGKEFLESLRASFASNYALRLGNEGKEHFMQTEYPPSSSGSVKLNREQRGQKDVDQDKRQIKALKMQGYFPGAVAEVKEMSDADLIKLLRQYFNEKTAQSNGIAENKIRFFGNHEDVEIGTSHSSYYQPDKLPTDLKVRFGYRQKPKDEEEYSKHELMPSKVSDKYLPGIYPKPTDSTNEINAKDPLVKFITVIVSEVIRTLQAKTALDRTLTSTRFSESGDHLSTTETMHQSTTVISSSTTEEPYEDICDQKMKKYLPEIRRLLYEKLNTREAIEEFVEQRDKIPFSHSANYPNVTKSCLRRFDEYIGLMADLALERLSFKEKLENQQKEKQRFYTSDRQPKQPSVLEMMKPIYPGYSERSRFYYHEKPKENYDINNNRPREKKDSKADEEYHYIIPNPWARNKLIL